MPPSSGTAAPRRATAPPSPRARPRRDRRGALDRAMSEIEAAGSGGPRWLNRNVVGMTATSFLSDVGHEMATSVLPAFMALMGIPPAALGAIEGVADATSSFVKLGAGWWSDRIGHRKPIV